MKLDTYYYFNDINFPVETLELWNMLWDIGLLITIEQDTRNYSIIGRLVRSEDNWDITSVLGNTPQECVEKIFDYIAKNDLVDAEFKHL